MSESRPNSQSLNHTPPRTLPQLSLWLLPVLSLPLSSCVVTPPVPAGPPGPKHVVVDKTQQELVAYEGERVALRTHVSTGREGHRTPSGSFAASDKEVMHYSRLYDDAPMPFSVQVHGNYFIHGFGSVPNHPASHGCIRMPMGGDNPAKRFFEWVEAGTPVEITGDWTGNPRRSSSRIGSTDSARTEQ